jgi:hypothetical protein
LDSLIAMPLGVSGLRVSKTSAAVRFDIRTMVCTRALQCAGHAPHEICCLATVWPDPVELADTVIGWLVVWACHCVVRVLGFVPLCFVSKQPSSHCRVNGHSSRKSLELAQILPLHVHVCEVHAGASQSPWASPQLAISCLRIWGGGDCYT